MLLTLIEMFLLAITFHFSSSIRGEAKFGKEGFKCPLS